MSDPSWPLESGRVFESPFFTAEELTRKCQDNLWLREGGPEKDPYYYPSDDYSYSAYRCETVEELKNAFLYGNWAIRQGFIYESLAFINQINAGDEWLALKKFDGGEILAFESCSMIPIINNAPEYLKDYIAQMLKATRKQCRELEYTDADFNAKYPR